MRKTVIPIFIATVIAFIAGLYIGPLWFKSANENKNEQLDIEAATYPAEYFTCPMHPHIVGEQDGQCPICGMSFVSKKSGKLSAGLNDDQSYPEVLVQSSVINNFAIKTEPVIRDRMQRNIRLYGYVNQIKNPQQHELKATVSGVVRYINFPSEGNKYYKDEIIFTLESDEILQSQKRYLKAINQNNVKLIRSLKKKLKTYGFTFKQLKQLIKTKTPTNIYTFRSPSTGIFFDSSLKLKKNIKAGQTVAMMTPLYSISVYSKVFETQWIWLKAGQSVSMSMRSFPGVSWSGEIRKVNDLGQSSTTAVKMLADFEENKKVKLRLGMQAEMIVSTETKDNVLQVPSSAVIRTGTKNVVVIANAGGRFQPVDVVTGIDNGEYAEITSGLKEGMNVVVSGQFLLDSESQLAAGISRIRSSSTFLQLQKE